MKPPILMIVQNLRWSLARGQTVRQAFENYLKNDSNPVNHGFRRLWLAHTSHQPALPDQVLSSFYQIALWDLILRSLRGEPVFESLKILEEEIERAAQAELDLHIATLPFKCLLPLLAFQFPAFLIMLLGPIFRSLQSQLGVF